MDVIEAVETRIEVREYRDQAVDNETIHLILNAGRLAPSGRNLQHWRFILIDGMDELSSLADVSPSGKWVADCAFAVAVCTDPSYPYHEIDAGRAVTHMQLVAWEAGVASRIYAPKGRERNHLEVPDEFHLPIVAGFGYPAHEIIGRKNRKPLDEVAFRGKFGNPLRV